MPNQPLPKDQGSMTAQAQSVLCEQLSIAANEIIRLRALVLANEERAKSATEALEGEQHV